MTGVRGTGLHLTIPHVSRMPTVAHPQVRLSRTVDYHSTAAGVLA